MNETKRERYIRILSGSGGTELSAEACKELVELLQEQPEQKTEKWVPCRKRLPEVDELVLVTDESGGIKTVDVDRCGQYECSGKRFWYYTQNAVAWMPRPEPYKEDE